MARRAKWSFDFLKDEITRLFLLFYKSSQLINILETLNMGQEAMHGSSSSPTLELLGLVTSPFIVTPNLMGEIMEH